MTKLVKVNMAQLIVANLANRTTIRYDSRLNLGHFISSQFLARINQWLPGNKIA